MQPQWLHCAASIVLLLRTHADNEKRTFKQRVRGFAEMFDRIAREVLESVPDGVAFLQKMNAATTGEEMWIQDDQDGLLRKRVVD